MRSPNRAHEAPGTVPITLSLCRMYGSKSQYGETPRLRPLDDPIGLSDFPIRGYRAVIDLGPPLEWAMRALSIRRAIGMAALSIFSGPAVDDTDAFVDEQISQKGWGELQEADYNWYISYVIQRDMEIPVGELQDRRFMWLKPAQIGQLRDDSAALSSSNLDLLDAYGSTVIDATFYDKRIVNDVCFVSASGRETFGLPDIEVIRHPSVWLATGSFDTQHVIQTFRKVAEMPVQRHDWLKSAKKWRVASLTERDPLRAFLWSYLTLELLVHQLFPQFYSRTIHRLQVVEGSCAYDVPSAITPQESRMPIEGKFAVIALGLSPQTAVEDTAAFSRVKKSRDSLAHGQMDDESSLPRTEARALLDRYLRLIVQHQITV